MTGLSRALIAAAAAALALPAGASAATVSAADGTLSFTAASGEANNLTVSLANGSVRFDDTGVAAMTGGPGCSPKGAQRVECAAAGATSVTVDLGDGPDRLTGQLGLPFRVYGGLGNDTIATPVGDDAVDGGSGADTIDTGWGDDVVDGGEGPDSIGGGYGHDRVVYAARTAAVAVSLDGVANDGAAGEGDNVRPSVDDIIGGSGADTLIGDDGANGLVGGAGDDVLSAAGGDDVLDGGAGTDTFSAGAGIDTLGARDGAAEVLACGSEADAAEADHDDFADDGCESVDRGTAAQFLMEPPPTAPVLPPAPSGGTGNVIEAPVAAISAAPLAVSEDGVTLVRLKCPSVAFEGCSGSILVEALDVAGRAPRLDVVGSRPLSVRGAAHRRLARGHFRVAAGEGAAVPVRFHRRAWRKLRRHRHPKVQITVTMENSTGTTTNTRTVAVRRGR